MGKLLQIPTRSTTLFKVPFETAFFKLAATYCGHIDLATPESGTYPLSIEEAEQMIEALQCAIEDAKRILLVSSILH